MSNDFEKHMDERISEMRDRLRKSRLKKKVEVKIFGLPAEKAWKNKYEIKPN